MGLSEASRSPRNALPGVIRGEVMDMTPYQREGRVEWLCSMAFSR